MSNLAIDIGNSRTKLGVFENDELIAVHTLTHLNLEQLNQLATNHSIGKVIYSTVAGIEDSVEMFLKENFDCLALTAATRLPFANTYSTPTTLGKDRLAVVAGAQKLSTTQNALVIDVGTCVTYDFLQDRDTYIGGNIAPGLTMRLKAMHHFTKALPLVEVENIENRIGKSTVSAMQIGGAWGMVLEIDGVINWALAEFSNLQVFLTGGDAVFFANHLKNKIFLHPNLVLVGLNQILNYNVQLLV
jgi:type III pantothenate kinase